MSGVGLIGAIVIGVLAGWMAEQLLNRHHGIITNLVVGLLGALIGGWVARNLLHSDATGWWYSLIASTAGAVILLFVLGLFRRPAR